MMPSPVCSSTSREHGCTPCGSASGSTHGTMRSTVPSASDWRGRGRSVDDGGVLVWDTGSIAPKGAVQMGEGIVGEGASPRDLAYDLAGGVNP